MNAAQEAGVGFCVSKAFEHPGQSVGFVHVGEFSAQNGDAFFFERVEHVGFAARAGVGDVDRRPDALGGDFAVEHEFHVPGAFEFLENDFIHAAAGVDEGCADDGEAAAFFEVSGSAEELARNVECAGGDAAGEGFASGIGKGVVVGAGQACDRVEQDQDVFTAEHARDGVDEDGFCASDVVFGGFVGGGRDDFEGHVACEVGGFFRALVDEQSDLMDIGIVCGDGFSDGLQDGCFSCFGRTGDQAALAACDGR